MHDLKSNISQFIDTYFFEHFGFYVEEELLKIKFRDEATLMDLKFDSLDIAELILVLEQEYGIMFNEENEINLKTTVGMIKNMVLQKVTSSSVPA